MTTTLTLRTGIFMPHNGEYEEYLYLTIEKAILN